MYFTAKNEKISYTWVMPLADFLLVVYWWLTLLVFTIAGIPIAKILFVKWDSKGYIFAKILGLAGTGFVAWVLGTLHILPFSRINIFVSAVLFSIIGWFLHTKVRRVNSGEGTKWLRLAIGEEVLFFGLLLFWVWVRGHAPDVHDLEKFMDFGFARSIVRSEYFPPEDMWFSGQPINYYYFGHLLMGMLSKLSNVDLVYGFNLMLASLFAWCFTSSFAIARKLLAKLKPIQVFLGGLFIAYLVTLGGNLHTFYVFTKGYKFDEENPPGFWTILINPLDAMAREAGWQSYWYPNATRFIPYTIHEFPSYSFVVSDIHGHVLDIPLALLAIALLVVLFLDGDRTSRFVNGMFGLVAGMMFTTNALDGPIYMGLFGWLHTSWVVLDTGWKKGVVWSKRLHTWLRHYPWKVLLVSLGLFIVGTLPFTHHFQSFVSGVGVNCAPAIFNPAFQATTDDGTQYSSVRKIGPLVFEGPEKCQKSPLWMLLVLWGYFLVCGLYSLRLEDKTLRKRLFGLLGIYSFGLIIFAEFFYFKDIYPQHFRSNTMFKLGYQAFMMMMLVSGVVLVESLVRLKKNWKFLIIALPLTYLVILYPFLSVKSYFGDLQTTPYKGLYGFHWFETQYPDDYAATVWLDEHIHWPEKPVVLEAPGDSYTDYQRVSMYTGLPTVAGWAVHEWLWRGEYGPVATRATEVAQVYEGSDLAAAQAVLSKYQVKYIFVGEMERRKYPNLNQDLIEQLGKPVFTSGSTRIYSVL